MHCEIYADVTGVVVDKGVFATKEDHSQAVGTEPFYANIAYFDGEQIKLREGAPYTKSVEVPVIQ